MVYIRHGDDGQHNPTHINDPSLVESGYGQIRKLTRQLLRRFGRPQAIYVSPMRRAWETALIMQELVRVPLVLDRHLSRYFTRSERDIQTVRPDTLKRRAPIFESKLEFRARVGRHLRHLSPCLKRGGPLVWCITHALVLKQIGRQLGLTLKDHFDFLETVVIRNRKWTNASGSIENSTHRGPCKDGSAGDRSKKTASVASVAG